MEIRSLNMLIRSSLRSKNIEKADEWFTKFLEIPLHPELQGVEPSDDSFNIMVSTCALVPDLARAEKYMRFMTERKMTPVLWTSIALVKGCIMAGEPRRGHRWLMALVKHGCTKRPNYLPEEVAAERQKLRSMQTWKLKDTDNIVKELAMALADVGHTQSANQWLAYLVEAGLNPEDVPEVWEYVRGAHPPDIVPALLSGESSFPVSARSPKGLARPGWTRPMHLSGEARPLSAKSTWLRLEGEHLHRLGFFERQELALQAEEQRDQLRARLEVIRTEKAEAIAAEDFLRAEALASELRDAETALEAAGAVSSQALALEWRPGRPNTWPQSQLARTRGSSTPRMPPLTAGVRPRAGPGADPLRTADGGLVGSYAIAAGAATQKNGAATPFALRRFLDAKTMGAKPLLA